jgi:predicted transcriptional regulator
MAEIKARSKAIGLPLATLAVEAKVARSTIFQIGAGRDPHVGTIDAIVTTLVGREIALLTHLIALHGLPEPEEKDAA